MGKRHSDGVGDTVGIEIEQLCRRRRATEDLGDEYPRLGYFDRSVQAGANLLIEKGVLTQDEIDRRMAEIKARRAAGV